MAKKISELVQTSGWNDDDLLELAAVDGESPTGYTSKAIRLADLIPSSPSANVPYRYVMDQTGLSVDDFDNSIIVYLDASEIFSRQEELVISGHEGDSAAALYLMDINIHGLGSASSEDPYITPMFSRSTVLATWLGDSPQLIKYGFNFAFATMSAISVSSPLTNDLYYTPQLDLVDITRVGNSLELKFVYKTDYNNAYPAPNIVNIRGYIDVTAIFGPPAA